MGRKLAVIDIGSNTIRLTVYNYKAKSILKEIENIKVSARLQSYLDSDQMLTSEGLNILLDSLAVFKEIVSLHKVTSIKVFATAAIRKAKNQLEIKQVIHEKTGFSVEVLPGQSEAYYGFLGVINSTYLKDGVTIDIGGGSTEITLFLNRKMVHAHSFPFGVISLKQQFIKGQTPSIEELDRLSAYLMTKFQEIDWLIDCQLPIIGIGGSARNLAKMDQAGRNYPIDSIHQYEINLNDIVAVKEKLSSLSFEEIQRVEGLSKERSDIIIPAIEVFLSMYRIVNAPFFQFSQKGIRDGILYEKLLNDGAEDENQEPLEKSLYQLAFEHDVDVDKRSQTVKTAEMIFNAIRESDVCELNGNELIDLRNAGSIYKLGEFFDRDSAGSHTFYLLSNRSLDGISHRDRIKLALLAAYHSKNSFKENIKPFKEWYTNEEKQKIKLLGAILKFSFILSSTKREIIQDIRFSEGKDMVAMEIYCNKSWQVEQQAASKQVKHLEHALGKNITLHFTSRR
ncbi:Ppx/GppA phosphatase family protein [Bacillus sp. T33-2]|uniref:Ppx/GppA phosphatase family protein n=1 Tax=Bacillus sp. T33-2 TaxID=2054168 RepID=UPI002155C943|nr:Ppx/GppA phosphatase family protein [Bacillus sp. T33-2]